MPDQTLWFACVLHLYGIARQIARQMGCSLEWSRTLHYRVLLMTDHAQAELEWRHQTRNVSSNYVISHRFLMAAQPAQCMQNVVSLYSYVHIYSCKRTFRGNNLTVIRRQNRLQWIPNRLSNKCKGNGPKLYLRMSAAFCTVQWQWWAYPYMETKRKTVSKLFRRYMDEILPIRCKIMNNQSINQHCCVWESDSWGCGRVML